MHNVEKLRYVKDTLKMLQCEHRNIFKVCLVIFQYYSSKHFNIMHKNLWFSDVFRDIEMEHWTTIGQLNRQVYSK